MIQLREGFIAPLSSCEWLTRIKLVAELMSNYGAFPYLPDESAYSVELRKCEEYTARQLVKELAAKASIAERERKRTAVAIDTVTPLEKEASTHEDATISEKSPDEWILLPRLRSGQLQLPHLFTRSRLVSVGAAGRERKSYTAESPLYIQEISGHSYGDTVIAYSGEELRTGDIELWALLLKLAAPIPLGGRVSVSARSVLQSLRRGTGGPAYANLRLEMTRLQGANLRIRSCNPAMRAQFLEMFPDDALAKKSPKAHLEVSFQLLGPASTDGTHWSLVIPREVRVAFGKGISAWFNEANYYSLVGAGLRGDTARRLYLFYVSHPNPWPFSASELREFLGSTMERLIDWRMALSTAHEKLKAAGLIKAWSYEEAPSRRIGEPTFVVQWPT
jgi:hypothetical protein